MAISRCILIRHHLKGWCLINAPQNCSTVKYFLCLIPIVGGSIPPATPVLDYNPTLSPSSLSFSAGTSTQCVTLDFIADSVDEPDELFMVVANPASSQISIPDDQSVIILTDDRKLILIRYGKEGSSKHADCSVAAADAVVVHMYSVLSSILPRLKHVLCFECSRIK